MCLMAILYKTAKNAPVLLAANREERFDRPSQPPKIQSGIPRAVCGIDRRAGGTWLGVNQFGLVAAVTNRRKTSLPADPRSRGLLCRELLNLRTAKEAAEYAAAELATGSYAGANYLCADSDYAAVVYGGNRIEVVELAPGLHLLTNGNLNDHHDQRQEFVRRMLTLHTLDSAVTFLAVAARAFSRKPDVAGRRGVVLTGGDYGTVSSTLLALPERIQRSVLQYAPGPPSDHSYDDLSALLRQVLSTEKGKERAREDENGELLDEDWDEADMASNAGKDE
ncbi:MAG: NRDE family protein [Pirellulales bacterium]|nr:NRDE family protein [Pirellulales bacterium]